MGAFKENLKQIPLFYAMNARIKCFQIKRGLAAIARHYSDECRKTGTSYDELYAVSNFRKRHHQLQPSYSAKQVGTLRIFWVGASKAQDESGFLQALEKLGEVTIFKNKEGRYGPLLGRHGLDWLQVREANDEALNEQVMTAHSQGGIDVLIGQMWAHLYSKNALSKVRAMGIPVINISMDDRLPDLWTYRNGVRMGAVGLGDDVDMTLTTSPETCAWYATEKIPALFWPLASDVALFAASNDEKRDIDILFIGNRYGVRAKIVDYLSKRGISVSCYGSGWPNGPVNAQQNIALSRRAKIILGVGTVGYCPDVFTLKLRDFDALMTGALYITHRNPDLLKLFKEGEHLECYAQMEELFNKLTYYLAHPAECDRIGKRGQTIAKAEHSWNFRLSETFTRLGLLSGGA